jgi:hypothetical protein
MVCEEKMRLLDEYTATATALHEATSGLLGKKSAEFLNALTATEAARAKCVKARLAVSDYESVCTTCASVEASKQGQEP